MKLAFFFLIFFDVSVFCACAQKPLESGENSKEFFPLPDSVGGYRTLSGNASDFGHAQWLVKRSNGLAH